MDKTKTSYKISYRKSHFSTFLTGITWVAALLAAAVLLFLVGFILAKGLGNFPPDRRPCRCFRGYFPGRIRRQFRQGGGADTDYGGDPVRHSFYCIWSFWTSLLRHNPSLGIFHVVRCLYPGYYDPALDYENLRGGLEIRSRLLSGSQLWSGSREAADYFQDCSSGCHARGSLRHYSCHGTCGGRNGCPDLYRGNRRCVRDPYGFRPYSCRAYVCALYGGPPYGQGLCNSRDPSDHGAAD